MQRSKVALLPEEIRRDLDQRLVQGAFAGFDNLETWLEERCKDSGIEQDAIPSRAGIHRHSEKLKRNIDAIAIATEQAIAIADAAGDDARMGKALTVLAQQKIYDVLLDFKPDPDTFDLIKGARAIAQLNQADVQISKFRAEVKEKIAAKFVELAKPDRKGIDAETLRVIREEIYGIV